MLPDPNSISKAASVPLKPYSPSNMGSAVASVPFAPQNLTLSEEQRLKMEENKRKAMERLAQRRVQAAAQAANSQ